MTSLPLIGITTYGRNERGNFYLPGEYLDSIRRAGGLPLMLAPGETHVNGILEAIDGIVFAGGGDFDPKVYNGVSHPAISRIDPERDVFELSLAESVLNERLPVLGVCRGFQLLNIVTGGDLIPHLPEKYGHSISHRRDDGGEIEHSVEVLSGRLASFFDSEDIPVMSKHHQALGEIPDCWTVVAKSSDSVIEALEHKTHRWMISVLWHPELSPNDSNQNKLFKEFVTVAGNYRNETKR